MYRKSVDDPVTSNTSSNPRVGYGRGVSVRAGVGVGVSVRAGVEVGVSVRAGVDAGDGAGVSAGAVADCARAPPPSAVLPAA